MARPKIATSSFALLRRAYRFKTSSNILLYSRDVLYVRLPAPPVYDLIAVTSPAQWPMVV